MTRPAFGRTAKDYRTFRAGFPDEIAVGLEAHGVELRGRDLVDVGTGTGALARVLAPRVATTRAIDPAPELLAEARQLDAEAGVTVTYSVGTAEQTGLETESADIVTAGQCWHWFDADAAVTELARVLRPGGQLVIAHFDWIPLPSNVVEATERLILEANPQWHMGGGTGLYPRWLTDLGRAGYADLRTFSFDTEVPYPAEAWVGRIRASAGIGGSLSDEAVAEFSDRLSRLLSAEFPDPVLRIPHRTWAVIGRRTERTQAGARP